MTLRGFCALAPESRKTRPGLVSKIGNSRRNRRASNRSDVVSARRKGTAAILFLQIGQTPRQMPQQMRADREVLDRFHRLAQKAVDQHSPRLLGRDAARLQIKQRRLVEIADTGAVAAFDVVGVDFELGLGVDDGAPADDQVAAQLVGVGLLRVLAHDDSPLEGAVRAIGRDALDQLAAMPAGNAVVYFGDDVRLVAARGYVGGVKAALRALTRDCDAGLVTQPPPL